VLGGFDEEVFASVLSEQSVGLAADARTCETAEGRTLAELSIRLLARLYPSLHLELPDQTLLDELVGIATSINPNIDIANRALAGISIGDRATSFERTVYAGSAGWDAYVSTQRPLTTGVTDNPFGPSAAACIAASELFKVVFSQPTEPGDLEISLYRRERGNTPSHVSNGPWELPYPAVLAGVGAIGNGTAWVLGRAPLVGTVYLVDPELVEVSNLQRYVLCTRSDEHRYKVDVAASHFGGSLNVNKASQSWDRFIESQDYACEAVLVAVDSVSARRGIQSSLPGWVANAWTQPGDLGLSAHGAFCGSGACLACLYLPGGSVPNEDEIVSHALGVPELVVEVRTLLHSGSGVPTELALAVARGLDLPESRVLQYVGRPLRDLYVEGVCGGAVIPLGATGMPRPELHVPLAHQSTLAGVFLGAALVRFALMGIEEPTAVTRLDMMSNVGEYLTQPALKAGAGRCICEDSDFIDVFRSKFPRLCA
jgi:hypothetical protein